MRLKCGRLWTCELSSDIYLNIDTDAIRRLRDSLIGYEANSERPALQSQASRSATRRRLAPFAETMYLVMVSDGRTEPEELEALTGALRVLCDGQLDDIELKEMINGFVDTTDDLEDRISTLGAYLGREREDREMAFTLAATVAMADDNVAQLESTVLELVATYFGISGKRATQLLEGL